MVISARCKHRYEADLKARLSEYAHYYNSVRIHEYLGAKNPH